MNISKRLSRLVTTVGAIAAVAAVSIAPSLAEGPDVDGLNAEREALISHLEESGVPDSLQDSLADKIQAGEPLGADSETAVPVGETTEVEDGYTVARKDYSDGSFIESAVEIGEPVVKTAPGTITPYAIKGYSSTGGTGYRQMSNCLVYVNASTYSANFRATWVYASNGVGTISKVWDSSLQVYLGSFTNKSLSITRKSSTSSAPAQARLKWRYTSLGGVAQGDSAIYLNVSKNSAWTTTN